MRTTIDIDDPILKKLKAIQARDGRSLGRLVSDLLAQAQRNIEALLRVPHCRTLTEQEGFWSVYLECTQGQPVRGNDVPDTHLAAILKQNGVTRLYTADRDFRRFDFLKVIDPIG